MTSRMKPLEGAKDNGVVNLVSSMVAFVEFEEFYLGFENGEIQFYDFELEEQRREGAPYLAKPTKLNWTRFIN
jgi:hypothetical protein